MTDRPSALVSVPEDALYERAKVFATRDKPSTSYLQRRLEIGYNQAAGLIGRMEAEGLISKPNRAGLRTVLVPYPAPAAPQAAGVRAVDEVARWHEDRAAFLTSKAADDDWAETEAQLHRDMAASLRAPSREPEGGAVRELLREAGKQFRTYEAHHRAKKTNEAYEKAEINARLAERIEAALATREEAPAPTCQKCGGGEIAGWCCQQCPAEFRENDAGVLIAAREEAPAEAGEPSLVDWFSQFIERHQEGCGSDTDALIACLDRVRYSYRAQPQASEDAQTVISAGRVLADALRQYGFPVSGGAKAALSDHGSAEALALNEACVSFPSALQAEQKAK